MDRRKFVLTTALAGLLMCAAVGLPKKPNVILIMTDDQGYGDLGCHGHPFVKTPNLDRLHSEAVRLVNYHAAPVCTPTRASLLTGRHCRHIGVENDTVLPRDLPTMANLFSDNGYATGVFGKWHLGDLYPYRPNDRGFHEALVHGAGAVSTVGDVWGNDYFGDTYWHNGERVKFRGFCTDVWLDNAMRFIEECQQKGKPFLCYIPTNIAHGPHYAPKEFIDLYEGKPGRPAFFAAITHFDKRVGELRAFLERSGLDENTILIYVTDNGSAAGHRVFNAGMRGGKGSAYDGGHRVPFFLYWPEGDLKGGRELNQLAAHIDVLPTLLDLCQLRSPQDVRLDGVSLKPILDGSLSSLRDRVLVESLRATVMTQRWRLLQDPRKMVEGREAELELYDIQADPGQEKNVAGFHPEVFASLKAERDRHISATRDPWEGFVIGSDVQNPTNFNPVHWPERPDLGWWQEGIIAGRGRPASIHAEVEREGTYEFSLRRWPEEVNMPIPSGAEVIVPSNDWGDSKTVLGAALPVVKARLRVADFEETIDVTDEMVEATFSVPLEQGDCYIRAEFLDGNGTSYGVYFVQVRRK